MLPRCYLMANGAERPGHRGLLSWVLGFHYLGTSDITWLLQRCPPPTPPHGCGGGRIFQGRGCAAESQVPQSRSGRISAACWIGHKAHHCPRLFTRPCTSGHTPLASHMEMRYLCSYAAASKSWPTGCPSGCVPWSEFLEPVLPKTFLLLLKRALLFRLLLFCSVPSLQRFTCEQTSLLPWLISLNFGLFVHPLYCHHTPNCYCLWTWGSIIQSLIPHCYLGRWEHRH